MPDGSKMHGGWIMRPEDIEGLTPLQIQEKFALPSTPKYVCDVELEAGTHLRVGEVNPLEGWGKGGGTQYDLIGQRVGNFTNERLLVAEDIDDVINSFNDGTDTVLQINAKVDTVELESGIWNKGAVTRGNIIDEALDNNVGHNYPCIDRIDADGVVTSVKSRDLSSTTYQDPSRLEYQIKKDIDALDAFSGRKWNGFEISSSDITGKQLQIVVPDVELSGEQIQSINNATKYANEKGIDIII